MTPRFVSYAQNREDVVLFRALGDRPAGFYIDVGAGDPEADSVTKAFYDRGWHGINVEPHRASFASLMRQRPRDVNLPVGVAAKAGTLRFLESSACPGASTFAAASGPGDENPPPTERDVEVMTLSEICRRHATREIDFLKIDVEGFEGEVLDGADLLRWRPRVVVVEATAPHSDRPSHAAWEPLLVGRKYRFTLFDGLNRFYVRGEESEDFAGRLATPANVHDDYLTAREWIAERDFAVLEAYTLSLAEELEKKRVEVREAARYIASLEEHLRPPEPSPEG